jgi:hypothetical protein
MANCSDNDSTDIQPLVRRKRPKKAPSEPESVKSKRFAFVSEGRMSEISKGYVPTNTAKQTSWAIRIFNDWRSERNSAVTDESDMCPNDLFEVADGQKINFWLSRFVAEVKNAKGERYPAKTIQNILAGLQRQMIELKPTAQKFLDRNNTVYRELHRSCDFIFRELRNDGVGALVCHARPFSVEEENKLWEQGIMAVTTPKALQRAIFFYVGKH